MALFYDWLLLAVSSETSTGLEVPYIQAPVSTSARHETLGCLRPTLAMRDENYCVLASLVSV